MKKSLYTLLITGALLTASFMPSKVLAAECTQVYGGSESCTSSNEFSIEKTVQTPVKGGNYVRNLSINDAKYSPTGVVSFKITVKNTGSKAIETLTVSDTFPQFLSFVSGPGNFDTNSKKLTFTVSKLQPGQTQTYDVSGKVAESNLMPSDQGVVCLINTASATDTNGATNTSSSQFCVQKSVLGSSEPTVFTTKGGLTSTPATGPEMLPLISLIPGALGGFYLRKKSVNK